MTRAASLVNTIEPRHASAEEYRVLTDQGSVDPRYLTLRVLHRQRFVDRYPDLNVWLSEPLAVRLGRLPGEPKAAMSSRVAYEARTYLVFLALTGRLSLDHDWLLALPYIGVWEHARALGLDGLLRIERELARQAADLGYYVPSAERAIRWVLARWALHSGAHEARTPGSADLAELAAGIEAHEQREDLASLHGSVTLFRRRRVAWRSNLHLVQVLLFHAGWVDEQPRVVQPKTAEFPPLPPPMRTAVDRWLATHRLTDRPSTVENLEAGLRRFTTWLVTTNPECATFAEVSRETVLDYIAALGEEVSARTGRPLAVCSRRAHIQALGTFFLDGARWSWPDVPDRPLLAPGDLPRIPHAVPRYIPRDQLERVTDAIRGLACPYQRAALLIARWCGARRGEIRRLELECLDAYPDGTPRLRIPAGKTYRERMVPLNAVAADAIAAVRVLRLETREREFTDSHTARATRYLFMRHGKLMSTEYLFADSLRTACQDAQLLTTDGKPMVSSHRFRHTVGTQLAERGARLHTIMSVLGHRSVSMSLVYAQISDREVLRDYESVLGKDAPIAGPYADAVRAGSLDHEAVEWLKTNFFKTELELGRCLRLPQEGPCECDLALSCAKFVTTPAYAPRLIARRQVEMDLVEDAFERGWPREAERHTGVIARIDTLLSELGEQLRLPDGSTSP